MLSSTLLEIDRLIDTLSPQEQLWLLERIAKKVRQRTQVQDKFADAKYMETQLAAMANDPHIQSEIAAINEEFAVTEMDGMENL
ncbi:hypothetical protein [Microseira sp. BLCC-F43]|jgi:hypothetical protein|uniref:hypothetical protein n=1 Tax=Microseira sp. BLCC-F43 TaxID=3153602 RepID=UPI0035B91296